MHEIAALYLCWAPAGAATVSRFLKSYHAHPAGASHRLYVILNGYTGGQQDLLDVINASRCSVITTPWSMVDLAAYRWAANYVKEKYICPLSAYARILCDGWLGKLRDALALPGVGLVGATGSWESHYTDRALWCQRANHYFGLQEVFADYPTWPNPHIRTTACLLEREHWLDPVMWAPFDAVPVQSLTIEFDIKNPPGEVHRMTKSDALLMESGYNSLTQCMTKRGLRSLVVGRGGAFEVEDWGRSWTFRDGTQDNLIVADNQTDAWTVMSAEEKAYHRAITWDALSLLQPYDKMLIEGETAWGRVKVS